MTFEIGITGRLFGKYFVTESKRLCPTTTLGGIMAGWDPAPILTSGNGWNSTAGTQASVQGQCPQNQTNFLAPQSGARELGLTNYCSVGRSVRIGSVGVWELGQEWGGAETEPVGKQLGCARQPRTDHQPLERRDRNKAGRGKVAFLRLTESHRTPEVQMTTLPEE